MSKNPSYPFALRPIGFSEDETEIIDACLDAERSNSAAQGIYSYVRLHDDNLQDPDLFLANSDNPRSLATLAYLMPTGVRPALLIGKPEQGFPYPCVPRPIRPAMLLGALDKLVEYRADALSLLAASDIIPVPERRRRDRPVSTAGEGEPSHYPAMRRPPPEGGLLIVDRNAVFANHVAGLLARRKVDVAVANDEKTAGDICGRQKIALLLINTSTPGVDPYRLCRMVRARTADRTAVVMLTGPANAWDQARAREADSAGFMNKPLAPAQLASLLKKFLPELR